MRSDPRFVTNRGERSRVRRSGARTIRRRLDRAVVATTLTAGDPTESPPRRGLERREGQLTGPAHSDRGSVPSALSPQLNMSTISETRATRASIAAITSPQDASG